MTLSSGNQHFLDSVRRISVRAVTANHCEWRFEKNGEAGSGTLLRLGCECQSHSHESIAEARHHCRGGYRRMIGQDLRDPASASSFILRVCRETP